MAVTIQLAITPEEIDIARLLLREYAAYLNESLGEEHICLDQYEREMASLPGPYAGSDGALLLAVSDREPAGCVALKPLRANPALHPGDFACEMKRLWVRPRFRGKGIGLALVYALIANARARGYTAMYLDTIPSAMKSANRMYRELGFEPAQRYNSNPILGPSPASAVEFFRLPLA